ANSKMEANFATLISQTQQLLQEVRRSTDDKIVALGDRLTKGETTIASARDIKTDTRQGTLAWIALGGLVVSVITGLVGFNLSHFVIQSPGASPAAAYGAPPGFVLTPLAPATPAPPVPR